MTGQLLDDYENVGPLEDDEELEGLDEGLEELDFDDDDGLGFGVMDDLPDCIPRPVWNEY